MQPQRSDIVLQEPSKGRDLYFRRCIGRCMHQVQSLCWPAGGHAAARELPNAAFSYAAVRVHDNHDIGWCLLKEPDAKVECIAFAAVTRILTCDHCSASVRCNLRRTIRAVV